MKEIKYRVYIGSLLIAASVFMLGLLFVSFYATMQSRLFAETADRLQSTAVLGAASIHTGDLSALVARIDPALSARDAEAIEQSPEYRRLSAALNRIRSTNPSLILYVYVLVPDAKSGYARFVADADVLRLREESVRTGLVNEKISAFNQLYDVNGQSHTVAALIQKTPQVASRFVDDPEYRVRSLMGLAPIFDQETGTYLASLGVDISDRNYFAFLFGVFRFAFAVTAVLLVLVTAGSLLLAWRLSSPIIALTSAVRRFGESDLSSRSDLRTFIKELYDLNANFNGMADRIQHYQERLLSLNQSLERFVPDAFLHFLSRKSITEVNLGDQIQKDMTIMFSDIRGFTAISEHLTPKQTFKFLNDYLSRIAPIIRRHDGFIDKYLGDGIMAIFPGRRDDAVRCALEIVQEVRLMNRDRAESGLPPISTGTGIHCGTMMMGTIGEEQRMQTTVIADSVNLASRIEALTKEVGASVLMSREVYNRLEDSESFLTRFIGSVTFKGKEEKVGVYEAFDQETATSRLLKATSRIRFEAAVSLMSERNYEQARAEFETLAAENPEDLVAAWYAANCRDRAFAGQELF